MPDALEGYLNPQKRVCYGSNMFKLTVSKTESRQVRTTARPNKPGCQDSLRESHELNEIRHGRFHVMWEPSSAFKHAVLWVLKGARNLLRLVSHL